MRGSKTIIGSILRLGSSRRGRPDNQTPLSACRYRLHAILADNIVPFWEARSPDWEHGGYHENFGLRGETLEQAEKALVAQARMLFFWSRLARSPHLPDRHSFSCKAAENGFRFLKLHMWDAQCGGFFRKVSVDGKRATDQTKHIYAQAFALLSIAEYCRLTNDATAISFLENALASIDAAAHDAKHGGYVNVHSRDWAIIDPPTKSANSHLHLLEAFTALYRVIPSDLVKERLTELLNIQTNIAIARPQPTLVEHHDVAWVPLSTKGGTRISYGHDLENAYLVAEACRALKIPFSTITDFCHDAFQTAISAGYDRHHGGVYFAGKTGRRADNRFKVWWVQAEALLAAIKMFDATGDRQYAEKFAETLHFVERYVVDWEHGEWRRLVSANGKPVMKDVPFMKSVTNKGDAWKQAYHTGRAMIECIDVIDRLIGETSG